MSSVSTLSKIPYVQQLDPRWCQSACIAMVLGQGVDQVDDIRSALEATGQLAGSPSVMGDYLLPRVSSYKFRLTGSLNDATDALDDEAVIITHGWFTPAGHVICLIGYEPDPFTGSYRFIVHDPWAEYNFPGGDHDDDKSGEAVRYSSYGIYATCVASADYAHAREIYARRELLSSMRNAWLHIIKL